MQAVLHFCQVKLEEIGRTRATLPARHVMKIATPDKIHDVFSSALPHCFLSNYTVICGFPSVSYVCEKRVCVDMVHEPHGRRNLGLQENKEKTVDGF